MPRNVRNFWLELSVDGRANDVACGPVSRDGGFAQDIYIRHEGEVEYLGMMRGQANYDGTLTLVFTVSDAVKNNENIVLAVSDNGTVKIETLRDAL